MPLLFDGSGGTIEYLAEKLLDKQSIHLLFNSFITGFEEKAGHYLPLESLFQVLMAAVVH